MSITLDLPEEVEKELSAEAGRLGLSLSDYVLQVLAAGLTLTDGPKTGAELVDYSNTRGLTGTPKNISDSQEHAEHLRELAERRTMALGKSDSEPQALHSGNSEFEQQKEAFMRMPHVECEQYNAQFVAARDGQIVDHDVDLAPLTGRFFDRYRDVPVYLTRIGDPHRLVLRPPLFSAGCMGGRF